METDKKNTFTVKTNWTLLLIIGILVIMQSFQSSDGVSQRYIIPAKPKGTHVYRGTIKEVSDYIVKMSNSGYQVQHLQVNEGYATNMVVMVKY